MEDLLRARIFLKDEQVEYEHDMQADAERYLNHVNELAVQKGVTIEKRHSKGSVHKEIVKAVGRGFNPEMAKIRKIPAIPMQMIIALLNFEQLLGIGLQQPE